MLLAFGGSCDSRKERNTTEEETTGKAFIWETENSMRLSTFTILASVILTLK